MLEGFNSLTTIIGGGDRYIIAGLGRVLLTVITGDGAGVVWYGTLPYYGIVWEGLVGCAIVRYGRVGVLCQV